MSNAAIFVYGLVVFAFVATALSLIGWGIVVECRSRLRLEAAQRREGMR